MEIKRSVAAVAAVSALLTVSACSGSDADTSTAASTAVSSSPADSSASGEAQHNNADVMFAQGMIPHHDQAVEMSEMVLGKEGIDPRVELLAKDIKAAQGPEIEQMRDWLTQWGSPMTMMPGGGMSGMPDHDMSGPAAMPGMNGQGMMSEQDMATLQNAQGVAASRLFLAQMVEHHRGAIVMAQKEIDSGRYSAALELAHSIVSSQQDEIATMEQLLKTL